jgi:hypothetical protein
MYSYISYTSTLDRMSSHRACLVLAAREALICQPRTEECSSKVNSQLSSRDSILSGVLLDTILKIA